MNNPDPHKHFETKLLLHGQDGSWELFPPTHRMPEGRLLAKDHKTIMEIKPKSEDNQPPYAQWLGNLVLLSFAIMVFFRLTYPRRFAQFFRAGISTKGLYQLMREWSPMNVLSLVFSLMYTIGFAIFIYAGSEVLGAPLMLTNSWIANLALLSGVITFVIYGKYLTIVFLSWLFQFQESGRRYLAHQIVYTFLFSMLLFPVLLSIIYNPSSAALMISAVLLTGLHALRLLRSFVIGLNERHIALHYLILYLCTLEIVPLVLLYKAVSIIISGQSFA
ncbi:MAG TPA: DUF4271 domain-containing protein [Bacteroidales bacterium]|nr:DUF4271 domain-containing protein [Bacteroidales bacterium]